MKQFRYYIRIPQDRVTRNTNRNTNFSSTVVTLKDHQNQESMSKFIIHQIFCACAIGLNPSRDAAKTGKYINNSRHLARKYARIFVRRHYLFREANSFPRGRPFLKAFKRERNSVSAQNIISLFKVKNVWMQRTTQRRIKLLDLSVAGSLVKEILVPDVTLSVDKTKLIARLVLRQKGKIYWPIFQLAELVFFRASTMWN